MKLNSFLKECSEKEVFKRLSIYVVSSWVLIQVLAVTWQPLALPEKSVTILIIALLIGFPLYIFFIWKTRLAPLEKEIPEESKKGKKKYSKFKQLYFTFLGIISILVAIAVSFIANNAFTEKLTLPDFTSTNKIGILNFGNNTGKPEFDIVSKMTSDWVIHGITQNKLGQVISPEIVNDYISIIKASEKQIDNQSVLKNYFKPGRVITGNFFLNGEQLIFQSSIMDGAIDKTLISFNPIECDSKNPLDCIESLKQVILGYFSTEEKTNLNLQDDPPKYKAYQYLLDAKTNFADRALYISLLDKAIAEDSNYFEPKVLRLGFYYNNGEYQKADSLRKLITPNDRDNRRQINLLNHYDALLAGNNRKIYATVQVEYNFAPFDMQTNSSTMVVAQQYVNRSQDVDSIFKKIDMEKMDLSNCTFCEYRIYTQALAKLELKEYKAVIDLLTPVIKEINELYLKRPLLAAYVRSKDTTTIEAYLKKEELVTEESELLAMYLFTGKEFLLLNDTVNAQKYLGKVTSSGFATNYPDTYAEAFYFEGDYQKAEEQYSAILSKDSTNYAVYANLAVAYVKNNKPEEAEAVINKLNAQRATYQYGSIDYAIAQYHAANNNRENAINYLLKSIADGNIYMLHTFKNDVHFREIIATPEFEKIMRYWY